MSIADYNPPPLKINITNAATFYKITTFTILWFEILPHKKTKEPL